MEIKYVLFAVLLTVSACQKESPVVDPAKDRPVTHTNDKSLSKDDIDTRFDQFKNDLIEDFWTVNPGYALYVGYYKWDDVLSLPDQQTKDKNNQMIQKALEQLHSYDITQLNDANASDYLILENQFKRAIWRDKVFKFDEWNPSNYNVAGGFGLILNTEYKSLDERLMVFYRRMKKIPEYY